MKRNNTNIKNKYYGIFVGVIIGIIMTLLITTIYKKFIPEKYVAGCRTIGFNGGQLDYRKFDLFKDDIPYGDLTGQDCYDVFCDYKGGYQVSRDPDNALDTSTFVIHGSCFNSISTARGMYSESKKQFMEGWGGYEGVNPYVTKFKCSDYVWSGKNTKTWDVCDKYRCNNWQTTDGRISLTQQFDDLKGVLYRKSDMAPFCTWTERKHLKTVRYWAFVPKGAPLAEFSLLSLKLSNIPRVSGESSDVRQWTSDTKK